MFLKLNETHPQGMPVWSSQHSSHSTEEQESFHYYFYQEQLLSQPEPVSKVIKKSKENNEHQSK